MTLYRRKTPRVACDLVAGGDRGLCIYNHSWLWWVIVIGGGVSGFAVVAGGRPDMLLGTRQALAYRLPRGLRGLS